MPVFLIGVRYCLLQYLVSCVLQFQLHVVLSLCGQSKINSIRNAQSTHLFHTDNIKVGFLFLHSSKRKRILKLSDPSCSPIFDQKKKKFVVNFQLILIAEVTDQTFIDSSIFFLPRLGVSRYLFIFLGILMRSKGLVLYQCFLLLDR